MNEKFDRIIAEALRTFTEREIETSREDLAILARPHNFEELDFSHDELAGKNVLRRETALGLAAIAAGR